jgi:hypothetical protein
MSSLAGMFQMLNQSVAGSPLAQGGSGQGMLDMASMGLGGAAGNAMGRDPYSFMNQGGQQLQAKKDLSDIDLATPEGKIQAAEIYGKTGDQASAMAMIKQAQEQKTTELALLKTQQAKESLAVRATKMGMDALSLDIRNGTVDSKDASKQLMEIERDNIILKRGTSGRKLLAKQAGIPLEEFNAAGLGIVSDETFKSIIAGKEGTVEAYTDKEGNAVMLNTDKFGKVFNKDVQEYMYPSEMGITQAPKLQRVHNVSNGMVERLALGGVDNFIALHETANDEQKALDIIKRNEFLLEDMPTGFFGPAEIWAKRIAEEFGVDTNVGNVQEYTSNTGKVVAQTIKDFGAGTGLSDADRDYAERIAAGDIAVDPKALKKILRLRREASEHIIKRFGEVKESTRKALPSGERGVLDMYTLRAPLGPMEDEKAATTLSDMSDEELQKIVAGGG